MVRPIKEVIMERDDLTEFEAQLLIEEAREQFEEYIDLDDFIGAEDICNEFFGLEPDYLDEFLL